MKKDRDKYTKILAAARRVFVKKGFHQTKVADITQRAGIGKGTVYLYFPDKESILFAILTEGMKEIIQIISQVINNKDENFLTKLQNLIKNELEFVENNRALFRMLFSERVFPTFPARGAEIKKFHERTIKKIDRLMSSLINQGTKEGILLAYDPYRLGMFLQTSINAFSMESILHNSNNIAKETPFLVDLFLKGAQKRKSNETQI